MATTIANRRAKLYDGELQARWWHGGWGGGERSPRGWSHACVLNGRTLPFLSRTRRHRPSVRRESWRRSKESVLSVWMRRLTATIVARHVNLSLRSHALCPMEFGSGTNGHHIEGLEHQMMGVYRNGRAPRHQPLSYKQKTRFSADRVA